MLTYFFILICPLLALILGDLLKNLRTNRHSLKCIDLHTYKMIKLIYISVVYNPFSVRVLLFLDDAIVPMWLNLIIFKRQKHCHVDLCT